MKLANKLFAALVVAAAVFTISSVGSVKAEEQPKNQNQPKTVVVAEGDTLSKIAEANSTTYLRIFYANIEIIDPDFINPGQKVRIPMTEEQLAERAAPVKIVATPTARTAYAGRTTVQTASASLPADASVWDKLAQCESGGNWNINTGNGYSGGLQFNAGTWRSNGGTGQAWEASREEQIQVAENIRAARGFNPWPACSAKLGLR